MGSDKKKWREASRWLRVVALSASTLSPFINVLLARLRAHAEAEEAVVQLQKEELASAAQSVQHEINLDWQERLQIVGATLNDLLVEMRESPYSQKLLQHGEELKERGSKLSQAVAERSGQLTQDIAERGSKLTQDISDRGGEISQEWIERSRKAGKDLAEQDRRFWIVLGFSCGLAATGIVTFVLVRRRMQKSREEEPPIQLYDNSAEKISTNELRGNIYSVSANGTKLEAHTVATTELISANNSSASSIPADAAFVGISSTKQYYPVEDPLDKLHVFSGKDVDVLYFSSEDDARLQGFTAAVR